MRMLSAAVLTAVLLAPAAAPAQVNKVPDMRTGMESQSALEAQKHLKEGQRLQFRAEFFNFTNTPNFLAPSGQVDQAAGDRVTATANAPRQIQIALKYNF